MQRNLFLKFCLTAAGSILLPLHSFSKTLQQKAKKGFLVRSGKDRNDKPLTLFGSDKFYCKVSGADTNGDLYIFDSTRLEEGGPPLHYHYEQDEWWYIISGEFLVRIGEETFQVSAGDCVYGPRGIPHTFAKTGKGEGKLIILFQPAGKMEKWFGMIADGTVGKMTEDERRNASKAYGFEHVGPPLTVLKKP